MGWTLDSLTALSISTLKLFLQPIEKLIILIIALEQVQQLSYGQASQHFC